MKKEYSDQEIEDFLAGQPNKELDQALKNDADLQEQVALHKDVMLGIQHFGQTAERRQVQKTEEELEQEGFFESKQVREGLTVLGDEELRQNIESAAQDLEKEGFFDQNQEDPRGQIRSISQVLLVAASLALLLWAGSQWISFSGNTQGEMAEFFVPYPSQTLVENIEKEQSETGFGGAPDQAAIKLLDRAMEHYKKQNFEHASRVFEQFIQTYPQHILVSQAQFYLAVAYLGTNQAKEASHLLERLKGQTIVDQHALRFYLALAYSQNNQSQKAIEILENNSIKAPYQDKAAALLKQLK